MIPLAPHHPRWGMTLPDTWRYQAITRFELQSGVLSEMAMVRHLRTTVALCVTKAARAARAASALR